MLVKLMYLKGGGHRPAWRTFLAAALIYSIYQRNNNMRQSGSPGRHAKHSFQTSPIVTSANELQIEFSENVHMYGQMYRKSNNMQQSGSLGRRENHGVQTSPIVTSASELQVEF